MGFLLPILIALGSLAYGELGLPASEPRPWLVAFSMPLPHLLAMAQRSAEDGGRWRLANWLGRVERAFPVLIQYAAVGLLGWLQSIEGWFGSELGLGDWPRPEMIVALGPFIVATLLLIDSQARPTGPAGRHLRGFQTRMFLTAICPIIGYVLLASLLGCVDVLWLGVQLIPLWGLAFTAGLLAIFTLGLPYFLRLVWDVKPMGPGPGRDLLQRVAELAGFRCRELLVWRTGFLMANAAIVGLFPRGRRVFFTDELLARMGPRQLAAVYAHEIGHAKCNHVAIFMAWTVTVFAGLDWALAGLESAGSWPVALALGLGMAGWLVCFGWLSRRIELQADLFSLELLQDSEGITSALQAVGGGDPGRGSWRHFSVQRRVQFLRSVEANPLLGIQLHRRIGLVGKLGLVLALVIGGFRMAALAGDYPLERAALDLGLGRYASATERLQGLEGKDAQELARLAAMAKAEGLGEFESLAQARRISSDLATRDLRAGELERAAAWLSLAALSGDVSAGAGAQWLAARGETPESSGAVPTAAKAWRELLQQATAPR